MVGLSQKVFHPFFPFEVRMKRRKEMKIAHALQRWNRILFVKNEDELGEDPASRETIEEAHLDRILQEMLAMFSDLKSQPLFKTNGPEDACGIFHKRKIVKDSN